MMKHFYFLIPANILYIQLLYTLWEARISYYYVVFLSATNTEGYDDEW